MAAHIFMIGNCSFCSMPTGRSLISNFLWSLSSSLPYVISHRTFLQPVLLLPFILSTLVFFSSFYSFTDPHFSRTFLCDGAYFLGVVMGLIFDFSSLLVPYNPPRTLRSSTLHFLTVPRVSTALQSRAFSISAPHLWNSLPISLRSLANFSSVASPSASLTVPSFQAVPTSNPPCDGLITFKRLLKTYLFDDPLPLAT